MSDKFYVVVYCVVLGVNKNIGAQYILLNKDNTIPKIILNNLNYKQNIDQLYIDNIKKLVYVSDIELMPQIISFNSDLVPPEEDTIHLVYASVISYTDSVDNELAIWKEFKFEEVNDYTKLIVDIIQKIK